MDCNTLRSDQVPLSESQARSNGPSGVLVRHVVALAAAMVILLAVLVVRSRGLWAPDELRYAQIVQQMDTVSDLFVLQLWGSIYTDKPPLFFWLARAVVPITGGVYLPTLLAPIVLSSCLLLWLTGRVATRWYGTPAAIASLLVLVTLPLFLMYTAIGRMDMLLALFVTAAVNSFYRGYVEQDRWAKWMAFAWMGIGLLAKGPFGVIFPLAIALTALGLAGKWRRLWCRETLAGVGVLLAIVASWIGPAIYFAGVSFVKELIGRQVLQRAVAGVSHREPIYFYLWVLPIMLLPWLGFVWPSVRTSWVRWRDHRDPRDVWLLCWLLVPLIVLSLVRDKLPVYLLPAMPPVAILIGRHWSELFARRVYSLRLQFRVGLVFMVAALFGVTFLAGAMLIANAPPEPSAVRIGDSLTISRDGETACVLLQPQTLCFAGTVLVLLAIVGWLGMRAASYRGLVWTFGTLAAVTPSIMLFVIFALMPKLDAGQSWRAVAEAATNAQDSGEPVIMYGLRPFAAYYLNRDVIWFKRQNSLPEFVQQHGAVWCVVSEDTLAECKSCCDVEYDPGRRYPSPTGGVLLVHLRSLAVAERADAQEEHRR